jgi:hypothetical protein
MQAPSQQAVSDAAVFTVQPTDDSNVFVLIDKDGVPLGQVKQPLLSVLEDMTLLGRANMLKAMSDFSNRYYPDAITNYLLAMPADKCQQCSAPPRNDPASHAEDMKALPHDCPYCGLRPGEMKKPEDLLSGFVICMGCRENEGGDVSFDGAPCVRLHFSRSQGRFWWTPGCNHWCMKRKEDDKWGIMPTCPMKMEHTVVNKACYTFPKVDDYWYAWRMASEGRMFVSAEDNQFCFYLASATSEKPNIDLGAVFKKVIPAYLRYHTTASVRALIARALSLERLKHMMHMVHEHKRYKFYNRNGVKARWKASLKGN